MCQEHPKFCLNHQYQIHYCFRPVLHFVLLQSTEVQVRFWPKTQFLIFLEGRLRQGQLDSRQETEDYHWLDTWIQLVLLSEDIRGNVYPGLPNHKHLRKHFTTRLKRKIMILTITQKSNGITWFQIPSRQWASVAEVGVLEPVQIRLHNALK